MSATAIPEPTTTAAGPVTTVSLGRADSSGRLTGRWTASPSGRVAYYQVLITAADQTVYSSYRTTTTRYAFTGRQGVTYTLRARAVDRAGAVGRIAAAQQTLPLDDRAAKRSGHWSRHSRHGDYLRTESRSAARGSRLRFHVSASSGSLWYVATPRGGKAELLVDGKRRGVLDCYARTVRHKQYHWSTRGPAHRITVVVLHHKRRASHGWLVIVDALLP